MSSLSISASPVVETFVETVATAGETNTAEFLVELGEATTIDPDDEDYEFPNVSDHVAEIIAWYTKYIPLAAELGMDVKSISHIRGNRFQITYGGSDPSLGWFLNIDEDGNNLITIRGNKYLIGGDFDE